MTRETNIQNVSTVLLQSTIDIGKFSKHIYIYQQALKVETRFADLLPHLATTACSLSSSPDLDPNDF